MSSLSRRACYKCGNVGHYAEVCTSTERLCYNCKQPGHESNGCPLPRTTESTCPQTILASEARHSATDADSQQQPNSAITAKVSAMCKLIARRCA
ncbi:gig suppressor [Xanthoria parietina]